MIVNENNQAKTSYLEDTIYRQSQSLIRVICMEGSRLHYGLNYPFSAYSLAYSPRG